MKKSFRRILPLALIASMPHLYAKDFVVGLKDSQSDPASYLTQLPESVKIKRVLNNLDMVILEAESYEDIRHLSLDPNISFVEEPKDYAGPKKFTETPVRVSQKNKIQDEFQDLKKITTGIKIVDAPKVWEKHSKGKGVKVLVLDSGIDEKHPDLVTNLIKSKNFLVPGTSARDNNGHGTHVSGTIAAFGKNLLGVAPEAQILMGKVCDTGCNPLAVIEGVNWGIEEKVDVINLSLGGSGMSSMALRAFMKAEANNIVVVAASGNDGKYSDSYPASYSSNLSVGAINEKLNIASFSNWSDELDIVAPGESILSTVPQGTGRETLGSYTLNSSTENTTIPMEYLSGSAVGKASHQEIVYVGLGSKDDFKKNNVLGKIALIKRGELTFEEKINNAITSGAVAAIVFNNEAGDLSGTLGKDKSIPAVGISKSVGEKLSTLKNVKVTVQVNATNYQKNDGTSMASPHAAGVAALIRAVNPSLSAKKIKELMKSTALRPTTNSPEKYGNGVVNAFKAIELSQKKEIEL